MSQLRGFQKFLLAVAMASSLTACTSSCQNKGAVARKTSEAGGIQVGHPSLKFDYLSSRELLISKADPQTGDRWSARIVRSAASGAPNTDWEIQFGPEGRPLLDRRADGGFILHLLDTLSTLQAKEVTLSGPPESFGLGSPLFQLRWKAMPRTPSSSASEAAGAALKEYELKLGGLAPNQEGFYALLPQHSPTQVQVVRGAALKMLEQIGTFDRLRLFTLVTRPADDFDEIEILRKGGTPLYAQREGDVWTDRSHKKVGWEAAQLLERVVHFRIQEFVDDASLTQRILPLVEKEPLVTVTLKTRSGQPVTLKVAKIKLDQTSALFATSTERSGAVFLLYDEVLKSFSAL